MAWQPNGSNIQHIVLADADLPDLNILLAHLPANTQVQLIHQHEAALRQIAQTVSHRHNLQSLHILGHGQAGRILLGNQWVDAQTITQNPNHMTAISAALGDDGHIWLYGCHNAQGAVGLHWLDAWALATGATVHGTDSLWNLKTTQLEQMATESHRSKAIRPAVHSTLANPLQWAWQRSAWVHDLTKTSPVLDASKSPTLGTLAANLSAPRNGSTVNSVLVSSLINTVSLGNFSDADGDLPGIAITGVNPNGTLWYSTNGGADWKSLATSTVSTSSALTLYADASTRIYFQPDSGYSGTLNDAITFQAWDRTGGFTNGQSGVATTGTQPFTANYPSYANDMVINGQFAYLLDKYAGMVIVDLSDLANPKEIASIRGVGDFSIGKNGNYAYVYGGGYFRILDVNNPTIPKVVKELSSDYVFDIAFSGNYAYLASNFSGLQIINVSNPAAPGLLGRADTSGRALGVALSGNLAFVADGTDGLQVIDVTSPLTPLVIGHYDTSGNSYDVAVSGNYAYVADGDKGLVIIDVSNPRSPTEVGSVPSRTTSSSGRGEDVVVDGNRVYLSDGDSIIIIDVTNPRDPIFLSTIPTNNYWDIKELVIVGGNIFVAQGSAGLTIIGQQSNSDFFSRSSDTVSLAVTPSNNGNRAPVVTTAMPDQTWTEGASTQYTVPSGTFTDPDGNTLSYSARLTTGAALPSWLSFNTATRVFSGTAPVGSADYTVRVTATDTGGLSTYDDVNFVTTTGTSGTADLVVNKITLPATVAQGSNYSFTYVTENLGSGTAGTHYDGISVDAEPSESNVLTRNTVDVLGPAATQTFTSSISTTGLSLSTHTLYIKADFLNNLVSESSESNNVLSVTFNVTAASTTDLVVSSITAPTSVVQGARLTFSYVAKNQGSGAAGSHYAGIGLDQQPSDSYYLQFDSVGALSAGATQTFTNSISTVGLSLGTHTLYIKEDYWYNVVSESDESNNVTSVTFNVNAATTNHAPVVATPMTDQNWAEGASSQYTVPAGTFTDPDSNTLTYTARLTTGISLPSWLSFNTATRVFSGTAPVGSADYSVRVTATDTGGLSTYDDVKFFTAAALDTSSPSVASFSPADEATDVAVASNIVVTFSEAISKGTGSIVLKTAFGFDVAIFDAATSSNLSISGNTLTINPPLDLGYSTVYKVEFAPGSIKDLVGNSYAGTTNYNFTTQGDPINQKVVGTSADELFNGGAGNDEIDGGAGTDTATYSGNLSNFTVNKAGGTYIVTDKTGANGTDVLTNIETLRFDDLSINLQVQSIAAAAQPADVARISELYIAFFNRTSDADGLAYWIGQLTTGQQSINQISESFYNVGASPTFASLTGFSTSMTNSEFINVFYKNVLGRPEGVDAGGLAYWNGKLSTGESTRSSLANDILTSAHSFKGNATWGWVADLLDNKIAVANTIAVEWGLTYNTDGYARGVAIAEAITPTDINAALALVGIVDADINLG